MDDVIPLTMLSIHQPSGYFREMGPPNIPQQEKVITLSLPSGINYFDYLQFPKFKSETNLGFDYYNFPWGVKRKQGLIVVTLRMKI